MATTVNKTQKILDAYKLHVLEHGTKPNSVFKFSKSIKLKEEDFYQHFNSFKGIEKHIWHSFFQETYEMMTSEEVYQEYSAREKLLSFYFTLAEVLKKNRSYILEATECPKEKALKKTPEYLSLFKSEFHKWVRNVLMEAKESEEIKRRQYLDDFYPKAMWVQCLFVIDFWIRDESVGFEKTDEAIERAVKLSFDLMAETPLESAFDFGKFLFQSR
ncbi:TetR family transcriptional regulator C-terminal domain-containing protein [Sediminitomix flava]|uniref:Tetracyclin repressor-like C-terminal domain-containing protein n=1 Tax=Sediminitomix flava TaxID=379075 RepID=A0A315ZJU5_SEDFL|nr:TetR family transcriptional regulator C-terminal domain-containing protein [Sediminitomix flava]PWJ34181.1 hypothetical protein BC781_11191 [Sediminitomix flava]